MRYYSYDSRLIENEQRFEIGSNMRKVGNALRAVAEFIVMFFLFVLINVLLASLAHHSDLFSFSTYRMIQEGTRVLSNDNALAIVYFFYQHSLSITLAFTFVCFSMFSLVVCAIGYCAQDKEKEHEFHKENSNAQSVVYSQGIISYRHKVSFLS